MQSRHVDRNAYYAVFVIFVKESESQGRERTLLQHCCRKGIGETRCDGSESV